MALEPREREAWDRVVRAARAAEPHLGRFAHRGVALRDALDRRTDRVAVLWAVWDVLHSTRRRRQAWYEELDDAFEQCFRTMTGAAGPSLQLRGTSTGHTPRPLRAAT